MTVAYSVYMHKHLCPMADDYQCFLQYLMVLACMLHRKNLQLFVQIYAILIKLIHIQVDKIECMNAFFKQMLCSFFRHIACSDIHTTKYYEGHTVLWKVTTLPEHPSNCKQQLDNHPQRRSKNTNLQLCLVGFYHVLRLCHVLHFTDKKWLSSNAEQH